MKSVSSPSKHSAWRHFWRRSFLGRVFGLALTSGAGGFFVGGLIGAANRISSGPYYSWWYWMGFTTVANGIWMMILGLLMGLLVFTVVKGAGSAWSASRKRRFARAIPEGILLPLFLSHILIPSFAGLMWVAWHRGFTSSTSDLGNTLGYSEMATLFGSTCIFVWLLARSSKTKPLRHKPATQQYRLLPLD